MAEQLDFDKRPEPTGEAQRELCYAVNDIQVTCSKVWHSSCEDLLALQVSSL